VPHFADSERSGCHDGRAAVRTMCNMTTLDLIEDPRRRKIALQQSR